MTKTPRTDLNRLTQQDAAALLGVTARTLREWPDAPRNADGTYSGPAVVAWYVARQARSDDGLDPGHERARRDKEAADKLALENAEARGGLARVSVMAREVSSLFADIRQNALGLPTKLAPQLVGQDADRIRAQLEDAVYELLTDIADYEPGRQRPARRADA